MTVIPLWPDGAPGSEDWTRQEAEFIDEASGGLRVRNVVSPTLTVFPVDPALSTGLSVVVAPGGGFFMLSWDSEGTAVAEYLAARGITAFVLKYRLNDTGPTIDDFRRISMEVTRSVLMRPDGSIRQIEDPRQMGEVVPLAVADGEQAVRLVKSRAAEWSIDPSRVGLLGFSAGAFVTAEVAVSPDPSARPAFVAPIYGGTAPDTVPDDAPPMFTMVAADDPICLDTNLRLAEAWRRGGRPVDLHVYSKGGHGFGANKLGLPVDGWLDLFLEWTRAL